MCVAGRCDGAGRGVDDGRVGSGSGPVAGIVENVAGATGKRYGVKDDAGHVMDTVKIIQDTTGGYLAVSHHLASDGHFRVNLATSSDLLNWHWVRELAGSNTGPGLTADDHPGVERRVRARLGAGATRRRQQPPRLPVLRQSYGSPGRQGQSFVRRTAHALVLRGGTPNIYSVTLSPDIDHSTIDIGGHYWWNCDRDRQQRGTLTNFNAWSTSAQPNFDNALLYWGVNGNIGDRDNTTFQGYRFGLIEGQYTKATSVPGGPSCTTTRPATRTGRRSPPTAAVRRSRTRPSPT